MIHHYKEKSKSPPPLAEQWGQVAHPVFLRSRRVASWLGGGLLALVPFHAFLTIFVASWGVNYTVLRLWSAVVLVALFGVLLYWLVRDRTLREWCKGSYIFHIVAVYVLVCVVLGARGLILGEVSPAAYLLGLWLNCRYLLYFLAVIIVVRYSPWSRRRWVRIALAASIVVAVFAVLQTFALPTDFLKHFGYNTTTIDAYETVNSNEQFVRIASTLRGANSLGAYLVIVITLVVAMWSRLKRHPAWIVVLGMCAIASIGSFSRSGWIGVIIALLIVIAVRLREKRHIQLAGVLFLAFAMSIGMLLAVFEDNVAVQNALYHTDDNSQIATSSNTERTKALKVGVSELLHEPFGRGVGSAGPASMHNTEATGRIAENYYLQIGQEIGWAGLLCYVVLMVVIALKLWKMRHESFALALFASLMGLFVINMLSHVWADDTVAFTWWGLAGVLFGKHIWRQPRQAGFKVQAAKNSSTATGRGKRYERTFEAALGNKKRATQKIRR